MHLAAAAHHFEGGDAVSLGHSFKHAGFVGVIFEFFARVSGGSKEGRIHILVLLEGAKHCVERFGQQVRVVIGKHDEVGGGFLDGEVAVGRKPLPVVSEYLHVAALREFFGNKVEVTLVGVLVRHDVAHVFAGRKQHFLHADNAFVE